MTTALFTATANSYGLALATTSSNITMLNQTVTPDSAIMITNSTGNLAFVAFSTEQIGNINHPTAGTSWKSIPVRTGDTVFFNPDLGTYNGNIVVSSISPSGTGTIYITPGVVK